MKALTLIIAVILSVTAIAQSKRDIHKCFLCKKEITKNNPGTTVQLKSGAIKEIHITPCSKRRPRYMPGRAYKYKSLPGVNHSPRITKGRERGIRFVVVMAAAVVFGVSQN